jgi:hypothetical protein
MSTTKIPKDVWQLIIDKIEPDSYKLPKFIVYDICMIESSNINEISGPFMQSQDDDNPYFTIHRQGRNPLCVMKNTDPKAFKLLSSMKQYYLNEMNKITSDLYSGFFSCYLLNTTKQKYVNIRLLCYGS